ncbi:MAG TPA: RsmE family RNA methyltransferase, partial [Candidatus Limnocylindrales bacterium]|nr:RsmE family RNA methyltransferase [Candidatus Limnocylindrales bacterium]
MSRFFVRAAAIESGAVTFDADETRHLSRVLRLGPGDLVVAVDGDGRELTVRLTAVGPRSAAGAIVDARVRPAESPLRLTLVQGLPKADKMDVIVRMATELGVARVVPIITERSVPRALPERVAARLDRWQRVAREAAKQCGRAVVPEVVAPLPVAVWLAATAPEGLVVCLWESATVALADLLPPPPVA